MRANHKQKRLRKPDLAETILNQFLIDMHNMTYGDTRTYDIPNGEITLYYNPSVTLDLIKGLIKPEHDYVYLN